MMQALPQQLYRVDQVREMEQQAIAEQGITGIDLMRQAGSVVFDLIKTRYPNQLLHIFCGAGNNAGDGYIIAALALKSGVKVAVYYLVSPSQLSGDALTAYQDYLLSGGMARLFDPSQILEQGIIIDALFGIGLNRMVADDYKMAIACMNQANLDVISVDVPSGLNADTGMMMGWAVKANITVNFIALKVGLFTGEAAEYCGEIIHSSLGLTDKLVKSFSPHMLRVDSIDLPKRHRCSHKGDHGHVLLIGGELGYSGAIKLAAEAALRVGSGLVSVATRPAHAAFINMTRPELMVHGVESVDELQLLLTKATVIVIGPGLGQSQWATQLLTTVFASAKPIVCDADALNLLAQAPQTLDNWILTPHVGEAARLLKQSTSEIAGNRLAAVTELQQHYGGVAILKGAGTLICNGEHIYISNSGNAGMATAGMGDVLSGLIAGLVAQGLALDKAARSAVYLHGKAADLSVEKSGEIGLLASDLMPFIRELVNQ